MDEIPHPDAPPGKATKYAQREYERRFLLAAVPPGDPVRITVLCDRYIDGTRIRLRKATETAAGATSTIYKLTQKVPAPDGTPGLITTFYLNHDEYRRLASLPAGVLVKTRYSLPPFAVDVFAASRQGLILAELELATGEDPRDRPAPELAVAEVTGDLRFTGGSLVATTRDELRQTLAEYGIPLE